MTDVHLRKGEDTQRRKHRKTEAEFGGYIYNLRKARERQQLPEARRVMEQSPPERPEGPNSAHTLISDSSSSTVREYISVFKLQVCGELFLQPQETNTKELGRRVPEMPQVPPSAPEHRLA